MILVRKIICQKIRQCWGWNSTIVFNRHSHSPEEYCVFYISIDQSLSLPPLDKCHMLSNCVFDAIADTKVFRASDDSWFPNCPRMQHLRCHNSDWVTNPPGWNSTSCFPQTGSANYYRWYLQFGVSVQQTARCVPPIHLNYHFTHQFFQYIVGQISLYCFEVPGWHCLEAQSRRSVTIRAATGYRSSRSRY